jgi:phosphatidylglycerophosphate synthase
MRKQNSMPARAVYSDRKALFQQTLMMVILAGVALCAAQVYFVSEDTLGTVGTLTSIVLYGSIAVIVASRILAFHPFSTFGWPNAVTLGRTVIATLIAGYTAEISAWSLEPSERLAWTFAILAFVAVALDGVDGWLARHVGPRSAFGARFDMESDALLIMILSVLALVLGKAGAWVLLIGGLRYIFVGAAYLLPWLDAPLPPSMRRKTVCVVQGLSLCLLAAPIVSGLIAQLIAGFALACLVYSFAIDSLWLYRHRGDASPAQPIAVDQR